MTTTRVRRIGVAAAMAVLLTAAACGGDGGDDRSDRSDGGEATASTGTEPASGDGGDGGDSGGAAPGEDGGGGFECRITAEQVGEVLGVAVEQADGTCSFAPGGDAGSAPAVGLLAQMAGLCDEDYAAQLGYTEPVAGLGVEAFLKTGGGATASIKVCGDAPFDVIVDTGTDTVTGIAAAETLALIALEA